VPMTERLDDVTEARRWVDAIPFHYEYTAGVAGEAFLRGLMAGRILAGYCPKCRTAALPARMYCVDCYSPTTKFKRAGPAGTVRAMARMVGDSGEVVKFAFIEFPDVRGGIIHRLIGNARVGSRVRPRFKQRKERTGAISDVLGFERTG
jgi:uncharacterized protein